MNPYIIIAFLIALAGAATGGYIKGGNDKEAQHTIELAQAKEDALTEERALQATINAATSDFINAQKKQLEKANALPKITLANDCTVPAYVGRVLLDAQGFGADAGTGRQPSPARPPVDSTCAAELDIAKRNYAEVCIPNAQQLTELQKRWELIRPVINGK